MSNDVEGPAEALQALRLRCEDRIKMWSERASYLRSDLAVAEGFIKQNTERLAEFDAAIARLQPQPEERFPLLAQIALDINRCRSPLPEIWRISNYAEAEAEYLTWCAERFGGMGAEPIREPIGLPNFVWRGLAIVPKVEAA